MVKTDAEGIGIDLSVYSVPDTAHLLLYQLYVISRDKDHPSVTGKETQRELSGDTSQNDNVSRRAHSTVVGTFMYVNCFRPPNNPRS